MSFDCDYEQFRFYILILLRIYCTEMGDGSSVMISIVLLLIIVPLHSASLWLPFISSSNSAGSRSRHRPNVKVATSEFSMQAYESQQDGAALVEDARTKQMSLNTCWQNAYRSLFASCSRIIADEEKHKQLAWQLSDCFVKDSGRPGLPWCNLEGPMKDCRRKLEDFDNDIYLQFFVQTNAICHQLQSGLFKTDTERLINDLKSRAEMTDEKLELLRTKSEEILDGTTRVHQSIDSIDHQTQQLSQKSSHVEEKITDVLENSQVIYEQTKGIAASQAVLERGQMNLKEKLESSMESLQRSYENMGDGMEALKKETVEIEKGIVQVGDRMSLQMNNLQITADDIEMTADASLSKQKQVLEGQDKLLEEVDFLTKFQSQALEDSKATLEKIAEVGRRQQEELVQHQNQIQEAHDQLIRNSKSILEAQEQFESKQATIFNALDKLFALHNAILLESRFIKSFFFYCSVVFLLYMLTSAKQTFPVRARLYVGLCATIAFELWILRFRGDPQDELQTQSWINYKVFLGRSIFLLASLFQIIYSIFTYRDYQMLNYRMLQELNTKMELMERESGGVSCLSMESDDTESDMDLYHAWIDKDLPEEVSSREDPDYLLPHELTAEKSIVPSSSSVTKTYQLRKRKPR